MFKSWFQSPQKTTTKAPPTPKVVVPTSQPQKIEVAKILGPQEAIPIKTPHEKLIEFLEKRGLKEKAGNLRNGDTKLNLSDNQIGAAEAKDIANALKDNHSLTQLSLSYNQIGDEKLKIINDYLQRNKTALEKKAEELNAEGNNLCSKAEYDKAIEKYEAALKIRKNLNKETKLYEENKIKAEKKYEEQQKQLENSKLNEVVNNFFNNSSELNICYQIINDDLAKLIANKLRNIETITTVNFSNSEISDAGIKIISEALKLNNIITHLDLHNNNIGDEGANLIAEFLKNNKTLKHLDIALNNITDDGIKEIIESLRENTTITYIDLTVNNISNTNQVLIEKYLQRNKYLVEENNKFKILTDELNTKIASEANTKDKATIENTINDILQKTKLLVSKTDIELIATSIQELLGSKLMKSKFIAIDEQLDELIEQQNTNDDISVLGDDATFG